MAFKPATLVGPDGKRIAATDEQTANRLFAAGYKLEQPPQTTSKRTDTGAIETFTTTPLSSSLFPNKTSFLNAIKEGLKLKSDYNQDLAKQQEYWRKQAYDTTTFAGKDKEFSLLSPSEQADIRSMRRASAQANLAGLASEAEYRETTIKDTLSAVSDLISEKEKEKENADKEERQKITDQITALNLIKAKKAAGLEVTDDEWSKTGSDVKTTESGTKTGGTISWRNNNPGNLKYSDWQKEYGATKDPNSAFAVFPSEESAKEAYKALLKSKTYSGLTPDAAMRKWSGAGVEGDGYSYQDLVRLGAPAISKSFDKFSDEEWNQFFDAQKKAEGWKEGTIISDKEDEITLTDAKKASIMAMSGLTNRDVINWTADDWISEESRVRTATFDVAGDYIKKETDKKTEPEKIVAGLIKDFGDILTTAEITSVMNANGYRKNTFGEWEKY